MTKFWKNFIIHLLNQTLLILSKTPHTTDELDQLHSELQIVLNHVYNLPTID